MAKEIQVILRGGVYQLKRRVPVRYRKIEPRQVIWVSLHTDSETTARGKALTVERDGAGLGGAARRRQQQGCIGALRGRASLPRRGAFASSRRGGSPNCPPRSSCSGSRRYR